MADSSQLGFITIQRKMLDWEWYRDINVKTLFLHCLLKANWKDVEWKGITINRGSFVTSLEHLSLETGLTIKQIRLCLDKLEKTNETASKRTNKYTVVSIVKYEHYQEKVEQKGKQKDTQEGTQRATNKQINNNILMSEIKISDDKKYFIIKDSQIEAEPNEIRNFTIAERFRKLFIKNLTEKKAPTTHQDKATFKKYVDPIRLMFEQDKVTIEQMREVVKYLESNEGEFWKSNILSTEKLRKQISIVISKKNEVRLNSKKPIPRN